MKRDRIQGSDRIEREITLKAPLDEVWPFFADATNLGRITPEFLSFEVLTPTPIDMHVGAEIDYRLKLHGLPLTWRTRIVEWDPPHRFADSQLRGPYALWHHTHSFEEIDGGTLCRDVVDYRLPLGPLGRMAHWAFVRRDVERIFEYRSQALSQIFEVAA